MLLSPKNATEALFVRGSVNASGTATARRLSSASELSGSSVRRNGRVFHEAVKSGFMPKNAAG